MIRVLAGVGLIIASLSGTAQCQSIDTLAGTGEAGYSGDGGPAVDALLNAPFDVELDRDGNLYFSDTFNHCVRRVDVRSGVITTVAGCGRKGYSGDGGPATSATLNEPYGLVLADNRFLYVVDRLNYCVRRVDLAERTIETVAGTGESGYSGDGGSGGKAMLREPNGVALDHRGKLYIADVRDQRVRVLDLDSGVIDTLCGTGRKEHTGDGGPYQEASLLGPRAVAMGPDGNVYICQREGHGIRKVDFSTGTIERFAGTGEKGYAGDGGPALEATFNGPKELDFDAAGNLYVVDTENQAIRRIDASTGTVTTVAGSGRTGGGGDGGKATEAELDRPHGVVAAPDGTLFIGDTLNHRIRVIRFEGR